MRRRSVRVDLDCRMAVKGLGKEGPRWQTRASSKVSHSGRQTHFHGWELQLRWDLLSQGLTTSIPCAESPVHRQTSSLWSL